MSEQYYLWMNEQQTGPFTMEQLKGMWSNGAITSQTQYWKAGNGNSWFALGDMVEGEIAREKREQAALSEVQASQVQPTKKEEAPIRLGEWIGIVLGSILFSALAFLFGLVYFCMGKPRRGGWLMIFAVISFAAWSLLFMRLNSGW